MELDANTRFEIEAAAFQRVHHMLAPGKDAREGPPYDMRVAAWTNWRVKNKEVIAAFLAAIEHVL